MTVDPTKRLTVPEVLAHEWTRKETPRYLRQIYRRHTPPRPPRIMSSLSSLSHEEGEAGDEDDPTNNTSWDEVIVLELAEQIAVDKALVMNALLSPEENAVKVAYALCEDQRVGYDCACSFGHGLLQRRLMLTVVRPVGEQEVVEHLTAAGSPPPSHIFVCVV